MPSAMMTRPIPNGGEPLPVIGLGTYRAFDVRLDRNTRADLEQVLRLFFAAGGTVIDSSPMYGRAEAVAGELLEGLGLGDEAFLATKVWTRGRRAGIREMKESLAKLRRPGIALMQIHNLVDWETHLQTLREWKADGIFRYIGITHYTAGGFDDLARVMKGGAIDFVQFPYSVADRAAEAWFLPLAADLGVATLINRPFEQDGLFHAARGRPVPAWAEDFGATTWGSFFLKYLLSHPAVTCAIPATRDPAHMADNLEAGRGRLPDPAERKKMAELFRDL